MPKCLMKGNEALAEAAIKAGCQAFFGYPITPQNEIPAYMAVQLPEAGGVFLQAESEISAINMVYGAAGAGAKVMTSSSSPGISLKTEGISYIAGAELPCLIVNIARCGPGLGGIQPAQSDYFQATKGGGHGDYRLIVLSPCSVQEMADFAYKGFYLAEKWLNPVMILADGILGQMMEPVEFQYDSMPKIDKPWATNGAYNRKPNIINTLELNPEELEKRNFRLVEKYNKINETEQDWEEINTEDAELILVAYGIVARICYSAIKLARKHGFKVGMIRPKTLFPFPVKAFAKLSNQETEILVTELSSGQLYEDVKLVTTGNYQLHFYNRMGGMIMTPQEIFKEISTIFERRTLNENYI